MGLQSNDEWADHLVDLGVDFWVPVFTDLVNIFIVKTQYYTSWKPAFNHTQKYPKMVAWLNNDSDCESNSELLGEAKNKNDYSFVDLTKWLNKKDAVKGKRPAVPSPSAGKKVAVKEKRKKEKKVSSKPSSESSEEEQEKEKAKKGKKKSSE